MRVVSPYEKYVAWCRLVGVKPASSTEYERSVRSISSNYVGQIGKAERGTGHIKNPIPLPPTP